MEELISLGRQLWENAEPGFFEVNTHKILSTKFKDLGFAVEEFKDIPGFIATIDGNYKTKPVALISEMDVEFIEEQYSSASSDVGNISQMKPTVMPGLPGVNGKFHNPDFRVTDEEAAYVFPSEFLTGYIRKTVDTLTV